MMQQDVGRLVKGGTHHCVAAAADVPVMPGAIAPSGRPKRAPTSLLRIARARRSPSGTLEPRPSRPRERSSAGGREDTAAPTDGIGDRATQILRSALGERAASAQW